MRTTLAVSCGLMLLLGARAAPAEVLVYVDLDVEKPGIQNERTIAAGDTFPIDIVVGEDGKGKGTSVFDRIVVGVYFNDAGQMLSVTGDRRPHAGEMANNSPTTFDALGKRKALALEELTLMADERSFPKGFGSTAGQAGLEDVEHPFEISKEQLTVMAKGKLNAGFTARLPGTSTILATAPTDTKGVTMRGEPVAVRYVPATVTVLESRAALAAKMLVENAKSPAEIQKYIEAAVLRLNEKSEKRP